MKFDWNPAAAAVYVATLAAVTYLVSTGTLHTEALMALLTWLAPGPWQTRPLPSPRPGDH